MNNTIRSTSRGVVTVELTADYDDLVEAVDILRDNHWTLTSTALAIALANLPEPPWVPDDEQIEAFQAACAHDGLGVSREHAISRLQLLHDHGLRL